jgi:hypothetical protein
VFILASQVIEGANSFMDPFVTIDFLPTLDGSVGKGHDIRIFALPQTTCLGDLDRKFSFRGLDRSSGCRSIIGRRRLRRSGLARQKTYLCLQGSSSNMRQKHHI